MSKNRNRQAVRKPILDVALLTCGLVDLPVFKDCVEAIRREIEGLDVNVYIMMNGLTPETRAPFSEIANTLPHAGFKHSSERVGFPVAANRIIRQGSSPLVLFVTDDVILHEGALKSLLETMKQPDIGLCGLKLIFPKDSTHPGNVAGRVQHIGHAIDIRGEITHPLLGWSPENPRCCISREVQSVTGGVFIVRRNIFLRAGGFFEGYGLGYFEDVDLCLSIRSVPYGENDGYKIWINTDAIATHITNASMVKSGQPIPMQTNKFIFQHRNARRMVNDTFTFW